ncbi:helix-turn-helix transcriptional regulator [Verrucomicrobiaceae bacterium R5-34]|nr:helix-turn-helix transcriptional regulator [Verrucomicrobiaceae bacterium R5-34]
MVLQELTELTQEEQNHLHDLWRVAAEARLTNVREILRRYTVMLADLLDAKNVVWLAAIHGNAPSDVFSTRIFNGWWCMDLIDFAPVLDLAHGQSVYFEYAKKYGPGADTINIVRTAGKHRVQLRQDVISDDEHERFWKTKCYYVPILGIKERMHAVYTVTPEVESYFLIDRAPDQDPFSERERGLARLAILGSVNLHQKLLLERGLIPPARAPLSPREMEAFSLLFTDFTHKEIAMEMNVEVSTAIQYINSIYRKFGVRGRNGLVARCV